MGQEKSTHIYECISLIIIAHDLAPTSHRVTTKCNRIYFIKYFIFGKFWALTSILKTLMAIDKYGYFIV